MTQFRSKMCLFDVTKLKINFWALSLGKIAIYGTSFDGTLKNHHAKNALQWGCSRVNYRALIVIGAPWHWTDKLWSPITKCGELKIPRIISSRDTAHAHCRFFIANVHCSISAAIHPISLKYGTQMRILIPRMAAWLKSQNFTNTRWQMDVILKIDLRQCATNISFYNFRCFVCTVI